MKPVRNLAMLFAVCFLAGVASAQNKTVEVGGAAMYPSKDIVANAIQSEDHTTFIAAVKAAGLVETLQGSGPFTVFAPTNSAFNMLPNGTLQTPLKPENKNMLTNVLTYHVVTGRLDAAAIASKIKEGNGKAELSTVAGGKLWAAVHGDKPVLMNEKGGTVIVTVKDAYQSNGVIHVIDQVVLPRS